MRLHFIECLKENVRKNFTTSKNTSIHTEPATNLQIRNRLSSTAINFKKLKKRLLSRIM